MAVFPSKLSEHMQQIKELFQNDQTLVLRTLENQMEPSVRFCLFYTDGMVNNQLMDQEVIRPLCNFSHFSKTLLFHTIGGESDLLDVVANRVVYANSVERTSDEDKIVEAIVYGDTVLLADGFSDVLILNTKQWKSRSIEEPEVEKVLRGPREGFTEALLINLSMLRRKIKTEDLKMEFRVFGRRTKTKACICYIDKLVNHKVLKELKRRLDSFDMDGAIDTNYIGEYIKDAPFSPIKTIGNTERPDVVAGKLLEGRVALFLDGTPVVLTMPYLFIEGFQSPDDYYLNYYFSSIGRLLRIIGFFATTGIPAIYVSLVNYHQEMLPYEMTTSIAMLRQSVPLPTVVESVIMLAVFEILRETGPRTPSNVGQALSIVGALVVGQAAVDAKLISAPLIIMVAITGITGLMLPHIKGLTITLCYILLALSSVLGLYGYVFGMMGFVLYLTTVRSFGVPVLDLCCENGMQEKKDIFVRSPWWYMLKRPKFLSANIIRNGSGGEPKCR